MNRFSPVPAGMIRHPDGSIRHAPQSLHARARRAGVTPPQFQRACEQFLREAEAAGLHVPPVTLTRPQT